MAKQQVIEKIFVVVVTNYYYYMGTDLLSPQGVAHNEAVFKKQKNHAT